MHRSHLFTKVGISGGGFLPLSAQDTAIQSAILPCLNVRLLHSAAALRRGTVWGGNMPRYTVHVRGEWLAVPCPHSTNTVGWLGKEAVRRYVKNKPDNGGFTSVEEVKFFVRRCKGLGLLDLDDTVEDALEDNEFVEVGKRKLRPCVAEQLRWCLSQQLRFSSSKVVSETVSKVCMEKQPDAAFVRKNYLRFRSYRTLYTIICVRCHILLMIGIWSVCPGIGLSCFHL